MTAATTTAALLAAGLGVPAQATPESQEEREAWTLQERTAHGEQLAQSDSHERNADELFPAIDVEPTALGGIAGPGTTADAAADPAAPVEGHALEESTATLELGQTPDDGFPVAVSAPDVRGRGASANALSRVSAQVHSLADAAAHGLDVAMVSLAVQTDPDGVVADPRDVRAPVGGGTASPLAKSKSLGATDETSTGSQVQLSIDVSDAVAGQSQDYLSRLRLVTLPACAATTPDDPECLVATPASDQSVTDGVFTGTVTLAAAQVGGVEPAALIAGVSAGVGGAAGNWGATPLSSAASWGVSEQTGSFSWSYPLRVPSTPGGLEPEVALTYDSGSLDGRTTGTNNQSSAVGDGWDLSTGGYIERKYIPCNDDKSGGNNASLTVGDLCWDSDGATLVLGGRATELVKTGPDSFVAANDDNTRVTRLRLPSGWGNGDTDGEYWQVTTPDGAVYTFGRSKRVADDAEQYSAWTVRVYGNQPGEPCYQADFASSGCNQGWRWNLDYVQDTLGNSMSLFYSREWNRYGYNNGQGVTSYVAGGNLARLEYGTRAGTEKGQVAPARVSFSLAERCLGASADCEPADLTDATKASWPDVPFDLICADGATSCPGQTAPSFFTRKMITKATTQVVTDPAAGTFRTVDTWTLGHEFPDPGTGDLSDRVLWLSSITHQGNGASPAVTLPATTFVGSQMPNRVDALSDGRSPMTRFRLTSIVSESGAETSVVYTPEDCVNDGSSVSLPSSPESNDRRCLPVWWTPAGSSGPVMEYFHKYAVAQVTEQPRDGRSDATRTDYEYAGPAWAYTSDDLTPAKHRTWSDWRGFKTVTVRQGEPALGAARGKTVSTFFQGMDGDRSSSTDAQAKRTIAIDGITDLKQFAGQPRSTTVYSDGGSTVVSTTTSTPWRSAATATAVSDASKQAFHVGVSRTDVATPITGGTRTTSTVVTYDSYGMPATVDDQGDTATTADDRCTRTTYARNTDANILSTVSRVETVGVACAATPARPAQVISDTRTAYDGGAVGAAPTKGLITTVQSVKAYSGTTASYVTTATTTYDAVGRPLTVTDALGRKTATTYTDANGLTTSTATTTPDPDGTGTATALTTTTVLDPAWGAPTKTTDANGNVTTGTYDALGRLTSVWEPGRVQGTDTATTTYAYTVAASGINAVVTKTLNTAGTGYIASSTIYDGLLRPRQTQTTSLDAANPGRVITDTIYDSRGLVKETDTGWLTTGTPAATLLGSPGAGALPSVTETTYDGAGRATAAIFKVQGTEKWRTTTTYGGDRVTVDPPTGATPTTTVSDARGNTTQLIEYLGASPSGSSQTTTYTYDVAGRLAGMKDAAGNTWTNTYDLLGRPTTASDPDKGTTTTTYDDAGQVITTTDARGKALAYTYDALGRRTTMRDTSTTGTVRASWAYDTAAKGKGLLASSSRIVGSSTYTTAVSGYDHHGRQLGTSVTLPTSAGALAGTYTSTVTYNVDGTIATQTVPKAGALTAETVYTNYDAAGMPRDMTGSAPNGVYALSSTWTAFGEPVYQDLGSNYSVQPNWSYELGTRRLASTWVLRDGQTGYDQSVTFTYDQAGNPTSVFDVPTNTSAPKDRQCFTYDGLRRLVNAWTPTSVACSTAPTVAALGGAAKYWNTYAYNTVGGRTTVTSHNTTDTITTSTYPTAGASGRPHAVTKTTAVTGTTTKTNTYAYDAAGNLTGRTLSGAKLQTLTWDPEGELASVAQDGNGDGDTADAAETDSYVYDADGNRLLRVQDGKTTAYLPGGTEATLSGTTVTAQRYYTFADKPVALRTGVGAAGTTTLISDGHQTAVLQVNQNGNVLTRNYTDPFGGRRNATTLAGDHGFLDKPVDTTGLTQVGARYYDPTLGVFVSVDPIMDLANPQQWNPYTYANNNPLAFWDPAGTRPLGPTDNPNDASGWKKTSSGWNWTQPKAKPPVAAQVPVRHAPSHSSGVNWRHVLGIAGGIAAGIGIGIGVAACIAATAGICAGVAAGVGTAVAGGAAAGGVGAAVTYGVTGDNGRYSWSGFGRTVGTGALAGGIFGGAGYGVTAGLTRVTALNGTRTLAANTAEDGVSLSLRYKDGWTAAQRAAADGKVAALNNAAQAGQLRVTAAQRSGTSASSRYRSAGNTVPRGADVDHTIDLQLGGLDDISNMSPLDLSVNRSLGSQIGHQLRGVAPGTCVVAVGIC
ncbi:RHS repeat-associated core domain-containing protein [Xylanimonas protaetiae]|uniref:Uncharacterized protein n=1 Tax=Xylanimonas protaetiae TaxID=2509457 RepID=A0A4P6EZB1_9MICO|nr:RHS repeat-associated core domain-containing protein [Xylanimonas protaetiae]QAY68790.1 hypothetical protein ET471_00950 [Xylanimonas protaetiae]